MAAVTSAVIAGGTAVAQTVSGISNTRRAKNAIDNFQRQELKNPFESVQISTLKADQQTEANLVNFASSVDALQRGGVRAVTGALPRLNQQNVLLQNLISQDLQRQDVERQRLIARGEERIQGIQERREEAALQGLGQQLQTGRQDTFSGLFNLASAGLSFGSAVNNGGGGSGGGQSGGFNFGSPNVDTSLNLTDTSNLSLSNFNFNQ